MNIEGKGGIIAGNTEDAREARAILDSIGMGIIEVDDKSVISYANKRANELFNSTHTLVGHSLFSLQEFHFSYLFKMKYDKVKSSGVQERFEEALPPNRRLRYNVYRCDKGTTIVIEDVTREWVRDESQRASLLAMNSLGEAIFRVRKSGYVFYVNEAACRTTGYSKDELTHSLVWEIFPALNKGKLENIDVAPDFHATFETEIRAKEGRAVPAVVSVTRTKFFNDYQYIVAAWDITRRKQAEKEVEDAKSQSELYLDLMGHDINNMHQVALGYLELASNMPCGGEQAAYIDKSVKVLQRSAQLIQNVRKLQKLHQGMFQTHEVDIGKVLTEVQREFGSVPNKRITANIDGSCCVMANDLLHDVIANLVSNAIKHTGDRADITVNLDTVKESDTKYCRVTVEDNGTGISDDLKERIFHRMHKGTARGMGLGLYIVKTLVDSYGGRVWVEDRVKGDHTKGAKFVVLLPAMDKPSCHY